MTGTIVGLLAVVVLILATGFFVAAEFALARARVAVSYTHLTLPTILLV